MKTLTCIKPHHFEMSETAHPPRGPGEALLRIRRIGICGTDIHAYHGNQPYFAYPRILGHEIVAEIEEIEANDQGLVKGDLVTVIPYISDPNSFATRNGKPNACENLQVIGVHVDGGMREYLSVPVEQLVDARGLSLDQALIVEPMSISLHGINRAEAKPGQDVVVLGAGPIGLGCMKFAKLAGARVIAVDVNAKRLDFARSWAGVDEAIDAKGDTLAELKRLTDGNLASAVIDCTGSAKAMMGAFDFAAPGGTVVYVSLVLADITFSDPLFHKKELTLKGSRAATKAEFATVIETIRGGGVDASAFITHRADFTDAIPAFQKWIEPGSGVIKATFEF
ncbi:zinc-binding alcohol dehydrogenase family protein (plasmid) [Bosea sp. F3-2]|uniref:zinc-binding alcohol dehydrogenase family protein n=1 Tax=Bosea sp. F3-2 TaxID=2599640 RepID=UPI0011F01558|nr:zinc-binding alcohol dehydrogenase family protein [Bosea sp. F3-2]QEL27312.1 zinc-binding alcohol dehydrogenase family protein [Bosea sp. F3-2]